MLNKLFNKWLRFNNSEDGSVLVVISLMLLILILVVNISVDMGRINMVRQNQQNAVDAAKRAANNYCTHNAAAKQTTANMQSCIIAQVNKYYKANAINGLAGSTIGQTNPTTSVNNGIVEIYVSDKVNSVIVKQ